MSKVVEDKEILQELRKLTEYWYRNIKPIQEKRLKEAMEASLKASDKKDGHERDSTLCDNCESALRSLDSLHLSV